MRRWLARSVVILIAGQCSVPSVSLEATGQQRSISRETAARALSKASPDVQWQGASALAADFDCDGLPDHVLLGRAAGQVFVGMVHAEAGKLKTETLNFAVDPSQQAAICAEPAKLSVEPLADEVAREVVGRRAP